MVTIPLGSYFPARNLAWLPAWPHMGPSSTEMRALVVNGYRLWLRLLGAVWSSNCLQVSAEWQTSLTFYQPAICMTTNKALLPASGNHSNWTFVIHYDLVWTNTHRDGSWFLVLTIAGRQGYQVGGPVTTRHDECAPHSTLAAVATPWQQLLRWLLWHHWLLWGRSLGCSAHDFPLSRFSCGP